MFGIPGFYSLPSFQRLWFLLITGYYEDYKGSFSKLLSKSVKKIVEDLHEKLLKSKIVIVTDYKGLNVAAINDLRSKLREAGVEFKVVKNSLLTRAAKETDVELIEKDFAGPSAIALSYDDPVAPAKVLAAFADSNDMLGIKAGVLKGKVLDLSAIIALSKLPAREVILAQLLSSMIGIPTALVRTLNEVPRRFLNVLQALKEQRDAA